MAAASKPPSPTAFPHQLDLEQLTHKLVVLSHDASVSPSSCAQHAKLLAHALALVSHRHAVSVPTRAQKTTLTALDELKTALQQHQPMIAEHEGEFDAQHQKVLQTALLALWANTVAYELLVALADLIAAVDFVPRALRFWNRRSLVATILDGPFELAKPEDERVTKDGRVYSLAYTLDAALEKMGKLKDLIVRIQATALSNSHELPGLVAQASRMLEAAYDTSSIIAPRRQGGLKQPAYTPSIRFEPFVITEPTNGKLTSASLQLSLERLRVNLDRFEASRTQFASRFTEAMAPCAVPSKLRQRWLLVTVVGVATSGLLVLRNHPGLRDAVSSMKTATTTFLRDSIIQPLIAPVVEIIRQETRESQKTLPNVPISPISISIPGIPALVGLVGSVVGSEKLVADLQRKQLNEHEMWSELLEILQGVILHARLHTVIYTGMTIYMVHSIAPDLPRLVRECLSKPFQWRSDVDDALRSDVRRLLRMLTKQIGAKPMDREVGKIMLLLHGLRSTFESNQQQFNERDQRRFIQDLDDLSDDGQQVMQQLLVIQRMYHSHAFLQPAQNVRWLLKD